MANNSHHKTRAVQEDSLKHWSRPNDIAGHFGLGDDQTSGVDRCASPLPDFQDCGDLSKPSCSPHREREKKGSQNLRDTNASRSTGIPADTLTTFQERLRDLCRDDGACHGPDRNAYIHAQAQHALALAGELGCLREESISWSDFLALCPDATLGSEHMVELDARAGLVAKTTIPPGFGLVPELHRHSLAVLRPDCDAPRHGDAIEFVPATPLEYLARWLYCNAVFGDDVRLVSVIRWTDGMISFGITQPQYHGVPADPRMIEAFFHKAGWARLNDPSGHTVFYNYAFGVLAIDAERRNCYLNAGGLQPFDVVLCEPNEALERHLGIFP